MKIEHITDTHGHHEGLELKGADILCFTGDCTNQHDQFTNHYEFVKFYNWLKDIRDAYSLVIFIPGNHDSYVFHNERSVREMMKDDGIEFLHKESLMVQGLKFYGDSICPRFGNWHYMTDRSKTNKHWELIPNDVDVLLTHTPPKGILDLTERQDHTLEMCGDSALRKRIKVLPKLNLHMFGHIHDCRNVENHGILKRDGVIFSNATSVIDGQFDRGVVNHGNIIEL